VQRLRETKMHDSPQAKYGISAILTGIRPRMQWERARSMPLSGPRPMHKPDPSPSGHEGAHGSKRYAGIGPIRYLIYHTENSARLLTTAQSDLMLYDMSESRSSMSNHGSGRRIASVANALRALRLMAEHREGLGVTQLASLLDVGKSSAHLLLATLTDQEFVIRAPDGRYQLGVVAFEVGAAAGGVSAFGGPLTPLLRGLADRCGEAVSLAAPSGRDAIIVQRVESASILRAEIRVGTRMPMHCSASGKYLLASMGTERVGALYPDEQLPQVTPHNIRSKSILLQELSAVRARGFARNDDEYTDGISAVATGVLDSNGFTAFALSVAGPSHRFSPDDWLGELMETAGEMSAVLQRLAPIPTPAPTDGETIASNGHATSQLTAPAVR
jgi:DNA-binding IclR family transcriptional regulator